MKSSFSIRTAIFSTVLAIALWTLVSLRTNYDVAASVPLEFVLPENRSIELDVPREIRLKLHGSGWHLLNLLYLNANARCVVDLTSLAGSTTTVTSQDIQMAFRAPVPASVIEVLSAPFRVQLGIVTQKKVPLVSAVDFAAAPGFIVIGAPRLSPDSVTLRGNSKLLDGVRLWRTVPQTIHEIRESQTGVIRLNDSLSAIVDIEPKVVQYAVEVQRSAEFQLDDVPVTLVGAPAQSSHQCQPMKVSLVLRGGVDEIDQLNREEVRVVVDYSMLSHDTTGNISPTVLLPGHLRVLSMKPSNLTHLSSTPQRRDLSERAANNRRN